MISSILRRYNDQNLGRALNSWAYSPPKSKKALGFFFAIIGGLIIAVLAYGHHLIPWLRKLSSVVQTLSLLLLAPLFAYLMKWQKDQVYTLFERGLLVQQKDKKSTDRGQFALWKEIEGCSYSEHGVRLLPKNRLRRSLFLCCGGNRMEVYSLCRERIDALRFGHEELPEQKSEKEKRWTW
jgi:hypothetical protein